MNHFANSFLSILLGWMRTLFASLLSVFQGAGAGFLSWMSRRWFLVAIVLVLAGLTLDILIYIARWRPQYVWRTRLHRLLHRKEYALEEQRFSEGFDTALTDFNFEDTPIAGLQTQEPALADAMAYYAVPAAQTVEAPQEFFADDQQPVERRRRSSRHSSRRAMRFGTHFHLPDLNDSGRYGAAYPAPPVRAREAFHEPVYPSMDSGRQDPVPPDEQP